ncbi:MAG: Spy/CpxP family protein refolding chaperone [Bacteroidales bacterium]
MDKLLVKNRILLILVIVLVLINVATIVTIVWQTKKLSRFDRPPFMGKLYGHRNFQEYVIKELHLDSLQAKAYMAADSLFRANSKAIFMDMQQLRKQMVEEILKANPDTVRLSELSKQLAVEHIRLKDNTFEFLLKLKKICNPDQQAMLNEHIRRMLEFEGIAPFGKGNRRWKQHQDNKPDFPQRPDGEPAPHNIPPAE